MKKVCVGLACTAAFVGGFAQQVRALAGTRPKKVLAKMSEEVNPKS